MSGTSNGVTEMFGMSNDVTGMSGMSNDVTGISGMSSDIREECYTSVVTGRCFNKTQAWSNKTF